MNVENHDMEQHDMKTASKKTASKGTVGVRINLGLIVKRFKGLKAFCLKRLSICYLIKPS